MTFEFLTLDYLPLEKAVRAWVMLRDLRDAPGLPPERWRVYDCRLKEARKDLDAARADLDQQRKREIEAWAKPRGLLVNWSEWDRTAA